MKNSKIALSFLTGLTAFAAAGTVFAAGEPSGGLTLLAPSSARAASLGESFTAVQNDVAGLHYNPASLGTLESGHASFLYEKGLIEDAYGHFMIGAPLRSGGWALSVGYYNGGEIALFDGTTESSVIAQQDYTATVGYGRKFGQVSLGLAGKYLRSELVERYSADAYAGDIGLQMAVTPRFNMGAALQNYGTELKFLEQGDSLPRTTRVGASYLLFSGQNPTTLFLDAPYYMNEKEFAPAAGLDVSFGLFSVRAGYRKRSDINEYSLGAGFMLGRSSLDYAFGLANELDSTHRVSLAMRFGGAPQAPVFVKKKVIETPAMVETSTVEEKPAESAWSLSAPQAQPTYRHTLGGTRIERSGTTKRRRVYEVKEGETLASIAQKFYGTARNWKLIYTANKHLIDDPTTIEAGQKIVLP